MTAEQKRALNRLAAGEAIAYADDPLMQRRPSPDVQKLAEVVLDLVEQSKGDKVQ